MVTKIYKKYKLKRSAKLCILFFIGISILILGIFLIIKKPFTHFIFKSTREQVQLVEGTFGYKSWVMDLDLQFQVHLFHVTNPEDVMQGANPRLLDYGPYVYTEHSVKDVIEVNETMDEIKYSVTRSYVFNKTLSGPWSEDDEVTILNMAYIGAANMLVDSFPFMLDKLGNVIQLLFTNPESIFLQGKVKDILFDGLKLVCDPIKYPEMSMLCSTFKMKKSPLMKATDTEGVYLYSLFDKINGSVEGPYTVNRGKKNISMLGFTTSLKNKRALRIWNTKECNTLIGTDSIIWTPMDERWPRLYTYSFDVCRNIPVDYNDTIFIYGLEGWRYVTKEKLWNPDEIQCYCPLKDKKPACLPKGLLDISKCQDAPIYASEPHFLHGDSMFLDFAQGLKPDESVHSSFIVVEPLTGGPLWGSKCIQFNMKLRPVPEITLLNNASKGYFPLFWLCKSAKPDLSQLEPIIKAHTLIKIMSIVQCVPFVIGLLIIASSVLLGGRKNSKKCTINPTSKRIPPSITSNATRRRMQH